MVEPNGVLDDGHRETVAVRLGVGHGASAYPSPIKATQPRRVLSHPQVMAVNPAAGLPAGRAADIFTGVLDRHHQSVRGVLNIDDLQRTGQQEGIHRPVLASVVRKARGTGLGARRLRKSREWPDNLSAEGQVGERAHLLANL